MPGPRHPLLARILDLGPVRHAASARQLSAVVRERARFAADELLRRPGVRRYHLRRGGRPVLLRHGTVDIWTFDEIFVRRLYEPPAAVARLLARTPSPLVLDLGANIGLFALDVLSRVPAARIAGWEPDPENAAMLRRVVAANDDAEWHVAEACAGTADGTVSFQAGEESASHVVERGAPGSITVPVVDVLERFAEAALVKIDIEGGEWALLADPRFAAAPAVVIEYHALGCPGGDPAATARELLRGHGYTVVPVHDEPDGHGMLWATREP